MLVVDDERLVLDLAVEIMRRNRYAPHGVTPARNALDLLEREPFDLVPSDVVMPELNEKAVAIGATGLLYEPCSHEELRAAVADALGR